MRFRAALATGLVVAGLFLAGTPAEAGFEKGLAAFKAGHYELAADELVRTAGRHPERSTVQYLLGWTYLKLGMHAKAEVVLHLAAWLRPHDDIYPRFRLAELYLIDDRHDEALEVLKEIDPSLLRPIFARRWMFELCEAARTGESLDLEEIERRFSDLVAERRRAIRP